MKPLSERQLRFVELWTGVATETAALAGYSNAREAGSRCIRNKEICRLIKEKRAAEIKPEILSRLDRQKFWSDGVKNQGLDYKDRLKASELLGKSEGDFLEKIQHSGEIALPPAITIVFDDDDDDE